MRIMKLIARLLLGSALIFAGIGHLTFSRVEFQAQVPVWLPLDPDFVVLASGVVEITLGIALASWSRFVTGFGHLAPGFLIANFPGKVKPNHEG
ncbi:MAG: hypothetical protein RLZZ579_300, partial [Actinomycetota bacterium]